MMMRVRRQTAFGEIDAPSIQKRAAGRDRDEYRRVADFGHADRGDAVRWPAHDVLRALSSPGRDQVLTGWGAFQRRSPSGGAANGTPLNAVAGAAAASASASIEAGQVPFKSNP